MEKKTKRVMGAFQHTRDWKRNVGKLPSDQFSLEYIENSKALGLFKIQWIIKIYIKMSSFYIAGIGMAWAPS